MRRPDDRAALTDEVARFQAEVQRLALDTVRDIIRQELQRRAKAAPAQPRARKPGRAPAAAPPAARRKRRTRKTGTQLEIPLEPAPRAQPAAEPAASSETPAAAESTGQASPASPAPAAAPAAATTATGKRKRVPWTRESIVNELAGWMLKGTAIDPTFVARHGPPGLVAAARRIFGRFDAALNVAALHFSKLYPEGPPQR